ncbi:hypothetical protein HYC85_015819 [Camellia sinensis]|uniref:Uncharacterized protein n=1 Tax=Camellia sinensis TaxID=4442 RepID=A0A7J7H021_CAMSI|nr:hypothetical protein HYC85_015819 [Camellia sinensis]
MGFLIRDTFCFNDLDCSIQNSMVEMLFISAQNALQLSTFDIERLKESMIL